MCKIYKARQLGCADPEKHGDQHFKIKCEKAILKDDGKCETELISIKDPKRLKTLVEDEKLTRSECSSCKFYLYLLCVCA